MARSPIKRAAVSPSDDGEEDVDDRSTADIKRIKLERGADAHANLSPRNDGEEAQDEEEEDEGEEFEDDEEEAGKQLEFPDDAANIMAYEAAREKQGRFQGTTSDAGLIKSVTLVDFMCHRHLKVDFGPRMNFLVGHNGSMFTTYPADLAYNRERREVSYPHWDSGGSRWEGSTHWTRTRFEGLDKKRLRVRSSPDPATAFDVKFSKAVITLTMANQGPEAFKPELYGPTLVIERTLLKTGGSAYKFRAERGSKALAYKRDELTQICQWWNIAVDSPLTILTQDQARSFLQNSNDHTIYRFFLEGAQLHSLAQSYTQTSETLDRILAIISQQQDQVPELQERVESLRRQLDASRKIVELKKKYRDIHKELAWSYVMGKEKTRDEEKLRVEELDRKLADILTETEECQRKWAPATEQVQAMEDEIKDFDATRKPLEITKARTKKKYDDARKELRSAEEGCKELERAIRKAEKEIHNFQKLIEDKQRAMNADEDPEQARLRKRHGDLDSTLRRLERDVPLKEDLIRDTTIQRDQAQDRLADIDRQIEEVGGELGAKLATVRNLEGQSTDRLSAFGTNLPRVLDDIRKARWVHSPPIGPLGMYVRLDDMRYKNAIHSLLGSALCGFAVRHNTDKATMLKILQNAVKSGSYRSGTGQQQLPPIFQYSGDMFEFASGDLVRYGETVLSKLRVEDDNVLRILINASDIEKVFVSPTIMQANTDTDRLLDQGVRAPVRFITGDGFNSTAMSEKRKQSGPYQRWTGNMLFTRDLRSEIDSTKRECAEITGQRAKLLDDRKMASARVNEADQRLADARRKHEQAKKGISAMRLEQDKIQEKLSEQPSNEIDSLEISKKEVENEKEELEDHLRATGEDKSRVQNVIDKLVEELDKQDAELEAFAPERANKHAALQVLIELRAHLAQTLKHWTSSRATTEGQRNDAAEALHLSDTDLVDWTNKARDYCHERIETQRTQREIEREREALTKSIAEAEKRQGVRAEEIIPAYEAADAKLRELLQTIKKMRRLHATLMTALKARRRWWSESRSYISVHARSLFIMNLQKRNFEGRLDFNHQTEQLTVRIKTTGGLAEETQDGQSQVRFKAPKNLSGGERSFSTVSLLLALWDTISCPIKCLDEWDVFLDHVNRALAAKMLVEGARESDGKQFILITPQDMAGVQTGGPDNRVIRLSDPTRNQATLEFQPA